MIVTNIAIDNLISAAYDRAHVAAGGEALTVAKVREIITPEVVTYLEGGDRDFEREANLLIDSVLRRERPKRANQLRRDLEWVLDYLENPEDAAFGIEAILRRAYPLGTQSGEDKTLQFWTRPDFEAVVKTRYREAAAVTRAAEEFDSTIDRVLTAMAERGTSTFGGLAPQSSEAAS